MHESKIMLCNTIGDDNGTRSVTVLVNSFRDAPRILLLRDVEKAI